MKHRQQLISLAKIMNIVRKYKISKLNQGDIKL
jgi:hypothetical protein